MAHSLARATLGLTQPANIDAPKVFFLPPPSHFSSKRIYPNFLSLCFLWLDHDDC
jgi:hypothetical protein